MKFRLKHFLYSSIGGATTKASYVNNEAHAYTISKLKFFLYVPIHYTNQTFCFIVVSRCSIKDSIQNTISWAEKFL